MRLQAGKGDILLLNYARLSSLRSSR